MAAANASARALRAAALSSPAAEFASFRLVIDCGASACDGERIYPVANLLRTDGQQQTLARLVGRLRCQVCGRPPVMVVLETGPEVATRGRMHRLSLRGPELMQPDRNW